MTAARLLTLTLLIIAITGATAGAQDNASTRISGETGGALTAADGSGSTTVTPAPTLPEAPTPHRAIDKKFIFVMGALGGAESLRFTSRKLVLDHEFAAGAPWVRHLPANQHLVAEYAALYASELLVAYEIKKPHSWLPGDKVIRKLWWAYPAAMTAIHIKNGIGNIRTQGPAGCPSLECAMQMQGP